MLKRKEIRTRGKIKFSEYFKKLDKGDKVAIISELAEIPKYPKKFHGRTGNVEGKKGECYVIKLKDFNMEKELVIHPVHLRKLK
ncbi:MAG: 50S ribosomal protein L21e [Nanoarchaeota archaeon]|nr:50S ribosomal protein L21e [Nanoarchaeota archaeon]